MQVNRFWSSVGSVAAYLFAIGLLQYLAVLVVTLFGLLPATVSGPGVQLVSLVLPVAATITYVNWRWNWKPEQIGLVRAPAAAMWVLMGLILGAVAAGLVHLVSALSSGGSLSLLPRLTFNPWGLLMALLSAFVIELIFRGAVISRYQADLPYRELLVAALLTPFAWMIITQLFRFYSPATGIAALWMAAMSITLTLLFLRTESVWLSAGLHGGMIGLSTAMGLAVTERGGLIVWGGAALVLAALDWRKLQGLPRRVDPRRSGRGPTRGRTIRGPWGPH